MDHSPLDRIPFGLKVALAMLAAAVVPILVLADPGFPDVHDVAVALVLSVAWAGFLSLVLAGTLTRQIATFRAGLDRLHDGDLATRVPAEGDDTLGSLAASQNRLASALAARNESLRAMLEAVAALPPRAGLPALVAAAERAIQEAFGLESVRVQLGESADSPPRKATVVEGPDPGVEAASGAAPDAAGSDGKIAMATIGVADDRIGRILADVPVGRSWSRADDDLLAIFGQLLGAAIRNAELYAETLRLAEQQREFLRGVSHDLQTPLTSIRFFAERIADDTHDERAGIITEQGERLSRLVEELLTLSRLETGTLRPEIDVLAPAPLIRRVWESLGPGDQPFTLDDRSAGWLVAADRDRLEQVLWALLDNTRKYGGSGAVGVTLDVIDPPGRAGTAARIVTTIRDHGPGIPAADRERVFDRFVRLESPGRGGTGLGLDVARGLVEAMGGRMWIDDVDDGAAFSFSLPAERIGEG